MANLRNLTEADAFNLMRFFHTEIKLDNPEATLKIFKQDEQDSEKTSEPTIKELIVEMKQKIDLMFDEYLERQIRRAANLRKQNQRD